MCLAEKNCLRSPLFFSCIMFYFQFWHHFFFVWTTNISKTCAKLKSIFLCFWKFGGYFSINNTFDVAGFPRPKIGIFAGTRVEPNIQPYDFVYSWKISSCTGCCSSQTSVDQTHKTNQHSVLSKRNKLFHQLRWVQNQIHSPIDFASMRLFKIKLNQTKSNCLLSFSSDLRTNRLQTIKFIFFGEKVVGI